MIIKRGTILTIIFSLILIFTIANNVEANCDEDTTNSECGVSISNPGHGAVELCNNCFVCGKADGVCPAWYSTGEIKDGFEVLIRKGTQDRLNETNDKYNVMYDTGNEACEYFGGTFRSAKTKNKYTDSWSVDSITGTADVSARDDYVKVICDEVPKTPSCDECVDPDCITEITGTVFTIVNDGSGDVAVPLNNSKITINPQNNFLAGEEGFRRENVSNNEGGFEINNAYSGNVVVTCRADEYDPIVRNVTLKPGKNIIDCRMGRATCQADCTLPSTEHGRACFSTCHGYEGCDFSENATDGVNASYIMNACEGRPSGFFYEINSTRNEEEGIIKRTGIRCCTEYPVYKTHPIFNIGLADEDDMSSLVSRLLTRSYRKTLSDGTPVFLNIIVYNK